MSLTLLSDTDILTAKLWAYDESKVYLAEKTIINYIGKTPEPWDEALSIATVELYKRMKLDNDVQSESTPNHSVTFRTFKNVEQLLGASLIAVLDGYRDSPQTGWASGSFSMI